jgi:hypothetical protein
MIRGFRANKSNTLFPQYYKEEEECEKKKPLRPCMSMHTWSKGT